MIGLDQIRRQIRGKVIQNQRHREKQRGGMAGKKTWHNKQLLVRRTPTGKTKFNTVGNDERQVRRATRLQMY